MIRRVRVDISRRFRAEPVRQVGLARRLGDEGAVALEFARRARARELKVGPPAGEMAEVLVEAALVGMMLRQVLAEVPFSERVGAVTGGLERVGDGFLRRGQSHVRRCAIHRLHAVTRLIPPREQTRPRGRANRRVGIALAEPHPARGDGINVRRQVREIPIDAAALEAEVRITRVVHEDEEDVRRGVGGG